ncbi:MAG: urease accessory protein [Gammaproteobacteria bacterium]|nr:urease accessory protein [Gammaproteobacteria bacterium]
MLSLLFLGFIIGMRHALEADHLAAMATLTSRGYSTQKAIRQGIAWGLGHSITLFIFGCIVLLMDQVIPERLAAALEIVVGGMLILLGIDVLWRAWKNRIHYHLHQHNNQNPHFHAHSHTGKGEHTRSRHQHNHDNEFPLRALLVGLIHGMAGSAALILLTLDSAPTIGLGLAYITLFGIGSIVGMGLLSMTISIPIRAASNRLTWLHNGLQFAIGICTLGIGTSIVVRFV